ncbi:tRNA-specific 2-thiouridylase MnmA isoform X2 [Capsicum annuum]|uniref:tRNA-specific 2-thiouridylase MnmA isoform X2 n=1 Tax=Capsicum annuum TaxID=4072 RepID=UPI001FB1299D|nr:tRNA-specific 2-thiouridylase MnmA isoform X2 [Capsicum annuum]
MLRATMSILPLPLPLPLQSSQSLKHLFSLYPFKKPLIHIFSKPRKITTTPTQLFSLKPLSVSSPINNYVDEKIDPTYLSCCMPHKNPLKVAVLVSGGVDSSVALRLLHAAGHSCTAFYLKIWFQVDIPLEVVHLTDEYWKNVVSYIIEEYKCGRTPNPDVLCNTRIKFGAFMDAIGGMEFDFVASGHYARIVHASTTQLDEPSILELSKDMDYKDVFPKELPQGLPPLRGIEHQIDFVPGSQLPNKPAYRSNPMDTKELQCQVEELHNKGYIKESMSPCALPVLLVPKKDGTWCMCVDCRAINKITVKDQTYFLSHLSQAQLKRLIFPLGCIQKDEVRMLAKSFNLPNQDRKDSQGICFLGKIKFSEFVARHIGESEGVILEAESGDYLGNHRGFWFYTIGQRQGLRLPGGPWYVVEKDIRNNVVYVSRNYFSVDKKRRLFRVGSLKWLSGLLPRQISELQCKVRHGPGFYNCSLVVEVDEHGREVAVVRLSEDDQGLAAGQFAAFYDRRICIGSGIILESWDDQGYPICARALEIARMEDKSKLGKPVKIMVKPEPIVSTI